MFTVSEDKGKLLERHRESFGITVRCMNYSIMFGHNLLLQDNSVENRVRIPQINHQSLCICVNASEEERKCMTRPHQVLWLEIIKFYLHANDVLNVEVFQRGDVRVLSLVVL